MEPLLLLLAGLPLAGILGLGARLGRRERRRLETWIRAARDGGLTDLKPRFSLWGITRLTGRSGTLRVRFQSHERVGGKSGTIIFVDGPALVPLSLRREGLSVHPENPFAPREIVIGDEDFDERFYVRGPHVLVRGVLDCETRRELGVLLREANLEISNGEIRAWVPAARGQDVADAHVSRVLSMLLLAARRLYQPADARQRLADNARLDPLPGVRLQNLLALATDHPGDPITRVALHRACTDRSDEIRVRAAALLDKDGRDTLMDVACDEHADDEWAARAISELGDRVSLKLAKEILGRALHRRHPQTARACLATLGHMGWPEGVDMLASVMGVQQGGELAILAARTLGETGLASAERPLIKALGDGAPDLRVAAAEALGRVGSAAAVLPLKQAEARHEHETVFRRAARQAIAEIHARTGGAPGQLSVATATPGTLSVVEDERGRLSLEHPDRH